MKNGLILETMLKSARRRTMDPGGAQSCSMTSCVSETRLIWHHAGTPFRVSLTVATTRTWGWNVRVRTFVAFRAFTCKGELDIRYFSGLSYESELDNRYFSARPFVWGWARHSILLGPFRVRTFDTSRAIVWGWGHLLLLRPFRQAGEYLYYWVYHVWG